MLQPDPKDIMTAIYAQLRNPGSNTTLDEPFEAPSYAVRVNCLLFAGLFTSMLVALLGILVKQWTRSYQRELAGVSSAHLRARIRHFRFNGAKRWHLASIVGLLSIFMHLALFISAVGIIDLLISTAPVVGYVALSVFLLGASFFVVTTLLPLFIPDAPFRSPLSQFLAGVRKRVKRNRPSAYLRSKGRHYKESLDPAKEEGLEDHIEQSRGEENDESSIVRTKISLDLDIICHLLSTADKSTERWLLDLCFEKLPNLHLLAEKEPHIFNSRDIIIEVYNFLAKGCIMMNKKGEEEVNSDRLPRARQLCKFLAWYLALPHTPEEKEKLNKALEKGGDLTILARMLSQDDQVPSIIAATTALGHIEHFKRPNKSDGCLVCQAEMSALADAEGANDPSEIRDEKKVQKVTSLLIKRTDCMRAITVSPEKTLIECASALDALEKAFQCCNPTEKDKKMWIQALSEKEKGASAPLKEAWFNPLQGTLTAIQTKRSVLLFRPGDTIISTARANLPVLTPPRTSFPRGGNQLPIPPAQAPFLPASPSPSHLKPPLLDFNHHAPHAS